jgi:hypothetical protein
VIDLKKSKQAKREILAWMQPGSSKRQQILSAVHVPLQPGIPSSLEEQVQDQQAAKVGRLLVRAEAEAPEAVFDSLARLDRLNLLTEQARDLAQEEEPDLWEIATQLTDGNPELMMYLRIETKGAKEPTEIPGAEELLEQMTMDQWLTALEQEVNGE